MIRYLKYLVVKRIPIFLSILVMMLLVVTLENRGVSNSYLNHKELAEKLEGIFTSLGIVAIISFFAVTIYEFSFKMRKVSVDQAYSFPIKRERYYLTRFIMGYLEVIIPLTISFIVGISIYMINNGSDIERPSIILIEYIMYVVGGLLFYSYIVFFYIQANNVIDGLVTVGMAIVSPLLLSLMIDEVFDFGSNKAFLIFDLVTYLDRPLAEYAVSGSEFMLCENPIYFMITIVLGVLAFISMFFLPKYFRSEDCGQKSNSVACYMILFPVMMVSMSYLWTCSVVMCLMLMVVTYLGYALYRRSFLLDKIYWIVFAGVSAIELVAFFGRLH